MIFNRSAVPEPDLIPEILVDVRNEYPSQISSQRFLLMFAMSIRTPRTPMMAEKSIFALENPTRILPSPKKRTTEPTISFGATHGHNVGLNGCIGMSTSP
jgi:hypothetical protein